MFTYFIMWVILRVVLNQVPPLFYNGRIRKKARWLFVLAHPDDESMFFGPLISEILKHSGRISIAMCTDGGLGGIPAVRKAEMEELCAFYKIQVFFLGRPDGTLRKTEDIIRALEVIYTETQSECVVTFDEKGVSGHLDHISCHEIVRALGEKLRIPEIYSLLTVNLFDKYVLPVCLYFYVKKTDFIIKSTVQDSFANRTRMFYHKSQLVWFRYFYIAFSFYMDCIILQKVKCYKK